MAQVLAGKPGYAAQLPCWQLLMLTQTRRAVTALPPLLLLLLLASQKTAQGCHPMQLPGIQS
jgi:hypothetical protein